MNIILQMTLQILIMILPLPFISYGPITTCPSHEIWIEVHDFSPGYGTDEMEPLMAVLDRHRTDRIIVFVIPNRDETEPIHEYEGFVEYLHALQKRGVEIGAHGYTHKGFEFYEPPDETALLVEKSKKEFLKANLTPTSFFPPRYLVRKGSLGILESEYRETFLLKDVIINGREYPYPTHEFMPRIFPESITTLMKYLYLADAMPVFRLDVHLSNINPETLKNLDEFLTWTDRFQNTPGSNNSNSPNNPGRLEPPNSSEIVLRAALLMEESRRPPGIKRTSYALLYNLNMYEVTGEPKYMEKSRKYIDFLISKQRDDGRWSALFDENESASSYDVLESSMATWALGEAYLAGSNSSKLPDSVMRGGDFLTKKVDFITFYGRKNVLGLKPNAMAFLSLGLGSAHLAALKTYKEKNDSRFLEKALVYKEKSMTIADALLLMQNCDGSWYDGPYYLPGYGWKTTSSWYQAMAIMGLASAYDVSENELYHDSVIRGIRWFDKMEGANGEVHGALFSNGTVLQDDGGSIMALQALAMSEKRGVDTKGQYWPIFFYLSGGSGSWDANLAFTYSELLAALNS
jgi:Uncharacterized protein conserved in bacteria (DUF2334)